MYLYDNDQADNTEAFNSTSRYLDDKSEYDQEMPQSQTNPGHCE